MKDTCISLVCADGTDGRTATDWFTPPNLVVILGILFLEDIDKLYSGVFVESFSFRISENLLVFDL